VNNTGQERAGCFLYVLLDMYVLLGLLQVYWFGFAMLPNILEKLEN
jgi:hypothetical protein